MTSPSPEVKPLPCPACGSSTAQRAVAAPLWQIVCDLRDGGCGLSSRLADTREEAVRYWNRRREVESRVSPEAAPNFAQMLSDFGEQERVFRPYAREYHAGNVNLQITDAVRDHLTAFVGFLTRRFADYAGHQSVTQNTASVSSVTPPSSAPEEATDELLMLRELAAEAKDWQERDCLSCHRVNDSIRAYAKAFPDQLHAAMVAIGERPPYAAARSSGEDQPAATDEIAALKRRAEAAEEDWQIAETEVASLKQQVIDSTLRAERLEAEIAAACRALDAEEDDSLEDAVAGARKTFRNQLKAIADLKVENAQLVERLNDFTNRHDENMKRIGGFIRDLARLRADRTALIERSVGVIQNGPDARKWYVLRGDAAYDTADEALASAEASK